MNKRILYIWKSEYPWDVRVEKFCNTLSEFGFEVLLLCRWKNELSDFANLGFKVKRVGFNKNRILFEPIPYNPFWNKEIYKNIQEFKPDLIIVREFHLLIPTKKAATKFNIPVLFDMAEYYPEAMRGWNKYTKPFIWRMLIHKFRLADYLEEKSIRLADGIITVCNELKERVIKQFGINDSKLCIVHNTPEKSWFNTIKKGYNNPPKIFAYHGHFSLDRNLDYLIKAFIKAAQSDSEIQLIMAGTGENFEEINQIKNNSNVKDRIHLVGAYKFNEIEKLYSETDIAILPYKANTFINHTISNKFFDYMGCGKPMIVSLALPMIRMIEETQSGIAIDCTNINLFAETILNMKNQNLLSMSVNGMKYMDQKYNWDFDKKTLLSFIKQYI